MSTEILQQGYERIIQLSLASATLKGALKEISKTELREIQMIENKQIQSDQSGQSRLETASVAWRLPPGEEVGMVALFQLHQKCVLCR